MGSRAGAGPDELLLSEYVIRVYGTVPEGDRWVEGDVASELDADATVDGAQLIQRLWEKEATFPVRVELSDLDGYKMWSSDD